MMGCAIFAEVGLTHLRKSLIKNSDFFKRVIPLALPICIRIEVYSILITSVFMLLAFIINGGTIMPLYKSDLFYNFNLVFGQMVLIATYIWIFKSIKDVAQNLENK